MDRFVEPVWYVTVLIMHDSTWSHNFQFVWTEGKKSFNNRSLHAIGDAPNPYEKAISIIGKTLSPFDEDNLIPCFGFGDGKRLLPLKFETNSWLYIFFRFGFWSLDWLHIHPLIPFVSYHSWSRGVQLSHWSFTLSWFWRSFDLLQKNSSYFTIIRLV